MKRKLCEHCGKNEAVLFYSENVNGVKKETSLCEECARAAGITGESLWEALPAFGSFPSLFSLYPSSFTQRVSGTCPVCGVTAEGIRREGRFGCSGCYDLFAKHWDMTPFVGRGYHRKEAAEPKSAEALPKEETADLKKQLKEAIRKENYELAARLRDRIREREGK